MFLPDFRKKRKKRGGGISNRKDMKFFCIYNLHAFREHQGKSRDRDTYVLAT